MEQLEMPIRCGIMDSMSAEPEIRARLMRAGRNYTRAKEQFDNARRRAGRRDRGRAEERHAHRGHRR